MMRFKGDHLFQQPLERVVEGDYQSFVIGHYQILVVVRRGASGSVEAAAQDSLMIDDREFVVHVIGRPVDENGNARVREPRHV